MTDDLKQIRVLLLPVGEPPKVAEVRDDLHSMQALVGGLIEAVYLSPRVVLWVNEEALLTGMPPNRLAPSSVRGQFSDGLIRGPAFLAAADRRSGRDVSLTDEEIATWLPHLGGPR